MLFLQAFSNPSQIKILCFKNSLYGLFFALNFSLFRVVNPTGLGQLGEHVV